MKKSDLAFARMLLRQQKRSGPTLESLKSVIFELSPDQGAWKADTNEKVYLLMQLISKRLDDPSSAREGLGLLFTVLSRGGSSAVEMAKPLFREKIESMYHQPLYKNERFLPRLRLMLDNYDSKVVCSVTSDAIHLWEEERFRAASGFLGSRELEQRGLKGVVKELRGKEIAKAGNSLDKTALSRAVELYSQVR